LAQSQLFVLAQVAHVDAAVGSSIKFSFCLDGLCLTMGRQLSASGKMRTAAQIVDGIDKFITATEHALLPSPNAQDVQLIVDDWPEYVLATDNPMAFLSPGMPSRMTRGSEG
jgi:hypothetical protein